MQFDNVMITRTVTKKDWDHKLTKFTISNYLALITSANEYTESTGVPVNLVSALSRSIKDQICFDSRERHRWKPSRYTEVTRENLSRLSYTEVDLLCRLSLRPASKADFLHKISSHKVWWEPEGFKPGIFNFRTQVASYLDYSEEFRRAFLLISFYGDSSHFEASLVPETDQKDFGLIDTFKKGIPKKFSGFIFRMLVRPQGGKWIKFIVFLDAFNDLVFKANKNYNENVVPFFALYEEKMVTGGGSMRTLSAYPMSEEPVDGNPLVFSAAEYEEELEAYTFSYLSAMTVPGVPTMSTHKFGAQGSDGKKLPCYKMALTGMCPNGTDCKYSHARYDLQLKARELKKAVDASPYLSNVEETSKDDGA